MTIAQTNERTPRKPLRMWPVVVAMALYALTREYNRDLALLALTCP
jgi:hypothetical protein